MVTAVGCTLQVEVMLYGVYHFGLCETWPELALNVFYIAYLTMIWMYFYNIRITTHQVTHHQCCQADVHRE